MKALFSSTGINSPNQPLSLRHPSHVTGKRMCRNPVEELLVHGIASENSSHNIPKQKPILVANPQLNCALLAVLRRGPI